MDGGGDRRLVNDPSIKHTVYSMAFAVHLILTASGALLEGRSGVLVGRRTTLMMLENVAQRGPARSRAADELNNQLQRDSLKRTLLEACAGLSRGFGASASDRRAVDAAIDALPRLQYTSTAHCVACGSGACGCGACGDRPTRNTLSSATGDTLSAVYRHPALSFLLGTSAATWFATSMVRARKEPWLQKLGRARFPHISFLTVVASF